MYCTSVWSSCVHICVLLRCWFGFTHAHVYTFGLLVYAYTCTHVYQWTDGFISTHAHTRILLDCWHCTHTRVHTHYWTIVSHAHSHIHALLDRWFYTDTRTHILSGCLFYMCTHSSTIASFVSHIHTHIHAGTRVQ